jgi:hypothetical protein
LASGDTESFISLSVEGSVQCCIDISGSAELVLTIFISHRPALRSGKSSAAAGMAIASAEPTKTNERSPRMARAPWRWVCLKQISS